MVRNAAVAGRFYPGTSSSLQSQVERLVDSTARKEKVIGIVSPHAGYLYSGSVAGATFSRIELAGTFVILGPNHTGIGAPFSIMTRGTWETPLGEVMIDADLASKILRQSDYLEEDESAHIYEHSIEVQLPFLQYFKPDIKIVPILLAHSGISVFKEIGVSIASAIKENPNDAIIIASSDMTHYESHKSAETKDMKAIEAILALDEDQLLKQVQGLNISMCGYGPTICLITAAKELGATEAELVRYQTSGDASGDYDRVVGYAGVIIK